MLVVNDDTLGILLRYNLETEGYSVDVLVRGDEADTWLRESVPDLLILDWMLPGLSGLELCRRLRLRPETQRLPVLMLTGEGEEDEWVRGLSVGTDDYLTKPFSILEFLAHTRRLLSRSKPGKTAKRTTGELRLDKERHRVFRNDREVRLGPTEYKLLEFLMQEPGRVFTRQQLLDNVWGEDIGVEERNVDVYVGRLRKSINRGRQRDPIRTVRGEGYALDERFG